MRKIALLLAIVFLLPTCFCLTSCKDNTNSKELVLNVYNWEEYIADGVIEGFEQEYYETTGQKVKVNYSTFGTCENMYNELKLTQNKSNGNFKYDLVCPSDYMIQRMIEEGMCEEFDLNDVPNYRDNTSQYILDLFDRDLTPANGSGETYKLSSYSACYMWGTMGFVYNPEYVTHEDMATWKGVLNTDYKNRITIKDSVRDSYILAMGIAYEEELNTLKSIGIDTEEYNLEINDFFNKVDKDSLDKTYNVLKELKSNLYGFEVDSGKNDMASGKLWINFAWSGDAVYIMDVAEESGTELYYSVPQEGSNIFFDGWVMPKGANKELAQAFLDYMFRTDIAVENMGYIGYTASTAGLDIFENALDWYGTWVLEPIDEAEYTSVINAQAILEENPNTQDETILAQAERSVLYVEEDFAEGHYYEEFYIADILDTCIDNSDSTYTKETLIYPIYDDETGELIGREGTETDVTIYARDLSYFFGNDQDIIDAYGETVIYTDTIDRQFTAQYPDYEVVNRCAIMKHLPTNQLEDLNEMWSSVKIGYMKPIYMVLIVLGFIALFVLAVVFFKLIESGKFGYGKTRKNLRLVKKEEIKD